MMSFDFLKSYLLSKSHFDITPEGTIRWFSDEESDWWSEMERKWRKDNPKPNRYEMQKLFLPRFVSLQKERGVLDKEEIRSRHRLEEMVENDGVKLRRCGNRASGCCPFHQERTPSFYIFLDKQRFYCFGCSEKGDIFDYVMKMNGISFKEALIYLNSIG
jgi:hypothetical protein